MNIKSFLLLIALVMPIAACTSNIDIAEKKNAVVLIAVEKKISPTASDSSRVGMGTGFFIKENMIITNHHVIEDAKTIQIKTENGKDAYEAEILYFDIMMDLAIVKLKDWDKFSRENEITYLRFAKKDSIEEMETVYSIGHPWGLTWSVSRGIISNKLRRPAPSPKALIQTDAKIYEGNSGGPLLDENGDVVGINDLMISNTGGSYGFAIIAPLAEKVLHDYEKYKESRWSLLGISIENDGVIKEVTENGAAAKAGIKPKDRIVSIQTVYGLSRFVNYDEFLYEVSLTDYQDEMRLIVNRDDKLLSLSVKPDFKRSNEFQLTPP